jgi:hypothetical protein
MMVLTFEIQVCLGSQLDELLEIMRRHISPRMGSDAITVTNHLRQLGQISEHIPLKWNTFAVLRPILGI